MHTWRFDLALEWSSLCCTVNIPFQDPASLEAFCMPFLKGEKRPATPAELMASRYVAYTKCNIDYLVQTLAPKGRSSMDRTAAEKWARSAKWQGLEILKTEAGAENDSKGIVEFLAHYSIGGTEAHHHERAEFERIDDTWYFVDGTLIAPERAAQVPFQRVEPKLGRNDACHCGSGKKYKKCHSLTEA